MLFLRKNDQVNAPFFCAFTAKRVSPFRTPISMYLGFLNDFNFELIRSTQFIIKEFIIFRYHSGNSLVYRKISLKCDRKAYLVRLIIFGNIFSSISSSKINCWLNVRLDFILIIQDYSQLIHRSCNLEEIYNISLLSFER